MDIEVTVGKKPGEGEVVDQARCQPLQPTPKPGEPVEAPEDGRKLLVCPFCFAAGYYWVDASYYIWITCSECNLPFRAC